MTLPIRLPNTLDVETLGHHRRTGLLAIDERSGLIYTCRGGLIDLGHVRATVDLVAFTYVALGGARRPVLVPTSEGHATLFAPSVSGMSHAERLVIASRVAFAVAVHHERSTLSGERGFSFFPEEFSAYSPEDLYSDLLGARVGSRAIERDQPYEAAVDEEIALALRELGAVDRMRTVEALDRLEGVWWSRRSPVPMASLLLRRRFEEDPPLAPWRLEREGAEAIGCEGAAPMVLDLPKSFAFMPDRRSLVARAPETRAVLCLDPGAETECALVFDGTSASNASTRTNTRTNTSTNTSTSTSANRNTSTSTSTMQWAHGMPASDKDSDRPRDDDAGWEDVLLLQSIRLLPSEIFAGVTYSGHRSSPAFGFRVRGGEAHTWGGDLRLVRYSVIHDRESRGLSFHIVGIEAQSLFFCRDEGTQRWHPPLGAWFQPCSPGGIGLGGRFLEMQYDGATGRTVVRPAEITFDVDLLQNAFTVTYLRRRAVVFAGVGLDTFRGPTDQALAGRTLIGLRGSLASQSGRWSFDLESAYRQSITQASDVAIESVARGIHRIFLGASEPRQQPEGIIEFSVELAHAFWGHPGRSMADVMLPVISDVHRHTFIAALSIGARFEALTF